MNILHALRCRLSYANVIATVALFFALTGGAMAAGKYLTANDPITEGDLAGSTYGNPVIGTGKVDGSKVADNSLTGATIDESTLGKVPSAASADTVGVGALVYTSAGDSKTIRPGGLVDITVSCPVGTVEFPTMSFSSFAVGTRVYYRDTTGGASSTTGNFTLDESDDVYTLWVVNGTASYNIQFQMRLGFGDNSRPCLAGVNAIKVT